MQTNDPLDFLEVRERFLPIQVASIRKRILKDPRLSPLETERLSALFEMVQARFHFEFLEQIERLKVVYDPFNPDRDTLPLGDLSEEQLEQQRVELRERFRKLLVDGNYNELTHEQLVACLNLQSFGGLAVEVDLQEYADLLVYYRGLTDVHQPRRSWIMPWRKLTRSKRILKRIAILVRKKDDPNGHVVLKLFKDVALEDLKMMTPAVNIRMPFFVKAKVGSTVAGGLGTTAWKLMTWSFTVGFSGLILFLAILAGFIGAFLKGLFSFQASKTKYMQTLSSRLYFQSVANNVSALTQLVDAAEEEESKELLLAYFMLYVERDRDYSMDELDARVEAWIKKEFHRHVDFEVDDAVRKLVEKDLMVEREVAASGEETARTILKVHDLPTTLRRLDKWWDEYFPWNNDGDPNNDRLADVDWPPPHEESANE